MEDRPCLTGTTANYIHLLLRMGFDKAVEWRMIEETPVKCKPPKKNRTKERNIWDEDDFNIALNGMLDSPLLHLAVHLAYTCTLRPEELVGLT